MLGYKRIVIAQNERGLHLHNRRLVNILEPGVSRIFDPLGRHEVQVYDLTVPECEHPYIDVLLPISAVTGSGQILPDKVDQALEGFLILVRHRAAEEVHQATVAGDHHFVSTACVELLHLQLECLLA